MKKLTLNDAQLELREVNNTLTYYMKRKKALQEYIQEENNRLKDIASPRSKAWELKHDTEFIELYGRERTAKEIGRLMGYCERQVRRFLNEKEV